MSYLSTTKSLCLQSFVGNDILYCDIMVYSDADFAGDVNSSKSTSGAFVAVAGPSTFAPISALCKKQSVVSHSSTESVLVALNVAIRCEGLPLMMLWDVISCAISGRSLPRGSSNNGCSFSGGATPALGSEENHQN